MVRVTRILFAFLPFLFSRPVYAATVWGSCAPDNVATFACIEPLFTNLVWGLIALAGVGLFVMLTIGGFSMLLSGGDPKKLEKARGTLTNAIIGIVIIVTSYLIIRTIGLFTGITNLGVFQVILR